GPLHQVDGSGLDRSDRASCQLLLAALLRSGPDGPLGQGLAVAGQTGTLEHRLVGTVAAGRLHAKTGSLEGVSALTGFMMPSDSSGAAHPAPPTAAFSLMVNGLVSATAGDALENRIGVLLAQYPQGPPASRLAPPDAGGP
ncbi:MAG: D-alanyl-D-alanine carboxypeptidase, partial [Actinomycetota bacterium]|nr:D-alanyl-D-alanine carboxypeptidase [Actinomycetota bacterium]